MLKRRLTDRLTLIRSEQFPAAFSASDLPYRVTIGVGGNIGDVLRRFAHLVTVLQRETRLRLLATSPVLKNPPFGFAEQDDFLNAVIVVQTSLQPRAFMRYLLRLERRFGRRRTFANAPRTLDLDILFFDRRRIRHPELTVPHPHWAERESVVIPLSLLPGGGR